MKYPHAPTDVAVFFFSCPLRETYGWLAPSRIFPYTLEDSGTLPGKKAPKKRQQFERALRDAKVEFLEFQNNLQEIQSKKKPPKYRKISSSKVNHFVHSLEIMAGQGFRARKNPLGLRIPHFYFDVTPFSWLLTSGLREVHSTKSVWCFTVWCRCGTVGNTLRERRGARLAVRHDLSIVASLFSSVGSKLSEFRAIGLMVSIGDRNCGN